MIFIKLYLFLYLMTMSYHQLFLTTTIRRAMCYIKKRVAFIYAFLLVKSIYGYLVYMVTCRLGFPKHRIALTITCGQCWEK